MRLSRRRGHSSVRFRHSNFAATSSSLGRAGRSASPSLRSSHCAARPMPAQRVPGTAQRVQRPHNASTALRSASHARTTRPRHCAARPTPAQRVPGTAQRVQRPHSASPALRSASNARTARPRHCAARPTPAQRVQSAHGASRARTERPIPARISPPAPSGPRLGESQPGATAWAAR